LGNAGESRIVMEDAGRLAGGVRAVKPAAKALPSGPRAGGTVVGGGAGGIGVRPALKDPGGGSSTGDTGGLGETAWGRGLPAGVFPFMGFPLYGGGGILEGITGKGMDIRAPPRLPRLPARPYGAAPALRDPGRRLPRDGPGAGAGLADAGRIRAGLEASCISGLNPFGSRETVLKAALAPLGKASGGRVEFRLDPLGRAKEVRSEGDGAGRGACARILTASSGVLKPEGVGTFLDSLGDTVLGKRILLVADGLFGGNMSKIVDGLQAEAAEAKAEASKAKQLNVNSLELIKTRCNADDPAVKALIKALEDNLNAGGAGAEDDRP
jgi:hypothetical protein